MVFIVDDDPDVREFLERLLNAHGIRTQAFADADSFVDGYEAHDVECLLLDYKLPNEDGLELQRRLVGRAEHLPVVMITGFGSTATAVEAMKLGAVDFIEKPFRAEALLRSVEGALERGRRARSERAVASATQKKLERLSPREREVLEHVVDGHSSKEIAGFLGLSKKTVDLHRSHIMGKLEADSIVDLITMVLTGGRSRRAQDDGQEPGQGQG